MQGQRAQLNRVLVVLFNHILRIEERELAVGEFADLSMREMHVIEAVAEADEANSMSAIAKRLGITVGSLTVSVATLVRKGYLKRTVASFDRRVVHVTLSPKGERANRHHQAFHEKMIADITRELQPGQMDHLMGLLGQLELFFDRYQAAGANGGGST